MGKLIKLRESLLMPRSFYQIVDENSVPAHIRESFIQCHSTKHLTENNETQTLIKMAESLKNTFKESSPERGLFDKIINKLKETGATDSRKLWKFPVSRFGNLNGNGRIYPRKLWENVIENQRDTWCGCCGLADHPLSDNDPGEFKNSGIVWLDMIIDDANNLIWAIGTFVGPYGRLAQEIIEAGGRIGFSSSGFGELLPDNKTIDPDSYVIERVADIVTNPSQLVYGDASNENIRTPGMSDGQTIEYSGAKKPVSITENNKEPKSKILEEKRKMSENIVNAVNQPNLNVVEEPQIEPVKENIEIKNNEETKLQESLVIPQTHKSMALTKLEQKAIERFVEQYQIEAENIKDPAKKLTEVKSLLNMIEDCDNDELKNRVMAQLIQARDKLTEDCNAIGEIKATYNTENLSELNENIKNLALQGTLLNEQVSDYKMLCEGLQERNRELHKENSLLKSKLALKEAAIAKKTLRSNKKTISNNIIIDRLNEKLSKYEKSSDLLKKENSTLKESSELVKKTNDTLKRMTTKFKELRDTNEKLSKTNSIFENRLETLKKKYAEAIAMIENLKNNKASAMESQKEANELKKAVHAYEGQVTRLQEKNKKLQEIISQKDGIIASYKKPLALNIKPKQESYVDGYLNFREKKGIEVENYWNSLVDRYGESVMPFENEIRGAKTYREAFSAFLRNRVQIDNSFASASNALLSPNITNKRERKQYLENAGMNFQEDAETSFEEMQKREEEKINKLGFR